MYGMTALTGMNPAQRADAHAKLARIERAFRALLHAQAGGTTSATLDAEDRLRSELYAVFEDGQ